MKDLERKLKEIGVDIKDKDGKFRSLNEIITEIAISNFFKTADEDDKIKFCGILVGDRNKTTMERLLSERSLYTSKRK